MIGSRLGHYTILERLGGGAMGEVFLAEDERLGRRVALKTLPPELAADPERRARLRREARALAALEHPAIVTVFSVEEAGGVHFLTMERVRGRTLAEALPPEGFELARLRPLAVTLVDAVAAAHARGVVHRDLKPGNLMLADDGRLKVLDFGLAKLDAGAGDTAASDAPTEIAATRPGSSLGTPAYMAPEQVRGEPADARSDLFALGAVLYELATGRRAFSGSTAAEVAAAILRDPPPALETVGGRPAPPVLAAAVARCLAKHPAERYTSAAELADALAPLAGGPAAVPAEPSVAVLPFANLSADPEQEYFCDGMAEEVINALVRVAGLKVVARTSAFAFKGSAEDAREVGRRLAVGHLVEGSVRKAGNRVRITAQLVDVEDGCSLWSERFDRELEDVFAIQDEIAGSIVDRLRAELVAEPAPDTLEPPAPRPRPANLDAYELYLKGVHLWNQLTAEGFRESAVLFRRALEIDPDSARAHFGLALWQISQAFWADRVPADCYREGERHALRALEIDPDHSEALVALANCQAFGRWEFEDGELSLRRALELGPGDAFAQMNFAAYSLCRGRLDDAATAARRAIELDPLAPTTATWAANFLFWSGRYAEGAERLEELARLHPRHWQIRAYLSAVHFWRARPDEAIADLERAAELSGGASMALATQALGLYRTGHPEQGDEIHTRLRRRAAERWVPPSIFVALAQVRGDDTELERAFEEVLATHDPQFLFFHIFDTGQPPHPRVTSALESIGIATLPRPEAA